MRNRLGASPGGDRATQAPPEAPAGLRHPVSVPSALARVLLCSQKSRLEKAVRIFAADRLEICNLNSAKRELARVNWWLAQPPLAIEEALIFQGPNDRGPLVDSICREADRLAEKQRRAA